MKKLLIILFSFLSIQTFAQYRYGVKVKGGGGGSADLSNYFTKGQIDSINAGYYTQAQIDSMVAVVRSEIPDGGIGIDGYSFNYFAPLLSIPPPVAMDNAEIINLGSGHLQNYFRLAPLGGHVGNSGKIVRTESLDNGNTWSDTTTVYDDPAYDDRNIEVAVLDDNRIFIIWRKYDAPSTYISIQTMYSDDEGETWSTPAVITPTYITSGTDCFGHPFKIGSRWFKNINSDRPYSELFYSDNNGTSWTKGITVWDGLGSYEPSYVAIGDTVICLARTSTAYFRMFISTDGAATFTDEGNTNITGGNYIVAPRLYYDTARKQIIALAGKRTFASLSGYSNYGWNDGELVYTGAPKGIVDGDGWRLIKEMQRPLPQAYTGYTYAMLCQISPDKWIGTLTERALPPDNQGNDVSSFYKWHLTYQDNDTAILSGGVKLNPVTKKMDVEASRPIWSFDESSHSIKPAVNGTLILQPPASDIDTLALNIIDSGSHSIASISKKGYASFTKIGAKYSGGNLLPVISSPYYLFVSRGDTAHKLLVGYRDGEGVTIGTNRSGTSVFAPAITAMGAANNVPFSIEYGAGNVSSDAVKIQFNTFHNSGTPWSVISYLYGFKSNNGFISKTRADGQLELFSVTGKPTFKVDSSGAVTVADSLQVGKIRNGAMTDSLLVTNNGIIRKIVNNYSLFALKDNPVFTGIAVKFNSDTLATQAYARSVSGAGGGALWGAITGTISSQSDLQSALDAKAGLASTNTYTGANTFPSTGIDVGIFSLGKNTSSVLYSGSSTNGTLSYNIAAVTSSAFGISGGTTSNRSVTPLVIRNAAGSVVAQGAASQTGDLLQFQNDSKTVLSAINASGNFTGNAGTVTNGLYSTGSYSNPSWLTGLAWSKITGAPTIPTNNNQLTNGAGYFFSADSLTLGYNYFMKRDSINVDSLKGQINIRDLPKRAFTLLRGISAIGDSLFTAAKVTAYTSGTTIAVYSDTTDLVKVTALAADATFSNPTSSAIDGQVLKYRIKDDGTARALTFGSAFRLSSDLAAPTTTIADKTLYLELWYNSDDGTWDCVKALNNF